MRTAGLAIAITLAGCHRFDGELWIFPLAEIDAEFRIGHDSRSSFYASREVSLHELGNGGDYCRILSPRNTVATLNGSRGTVFPGEEYAFGRERQCIDPAFGWESGVDGTATFVISDDTASWTMIVERPFQPLEARLATHEMTNPLRPGETVVLDIDTVHGLANPHVILRDEHGEVLLDYVEGAGLTRTGNQLSFTMPAVSVAASGTLSFSVDVVLVFTRCDAPRGCMNGDIFRDSLRVMLEP